MTFRFASLPYILLLFPVLLAWWHVHRRRRVTGIVFSLASRTPPVRTWRQRLLIALPSLFILGLTLLVVSLARPQKVLSTQRSTTDAVAIAMVVDISGSMEALDLSEQTATGIKWRTRLDAAKEAFEEFVDARPNDLISLVSFAGYASTRVPLTMDHEVLRYVLRNIVIPKPVLDSSGRPADETEYLTAVGDALATACARLEKAIPKSRIIVLLSDGESNTGIMPPLDAAELARKLGFRVYTIGIGTSGDAPFRVTMPDGSETIQRGRVSMDPETMKAIAAKTGGQFFQIGDNDGLKEALSSIDKLEKTSIEEELYSQYDELFPYALWPGLGILITASLAHLTLGRRLI
jgi:Ca-activated chloride channel family protein